MSFDERLQHLQQYPDDLKSLGDLETMLTDGRAPSGQDLHALRDLADRLLAALYYEAGTRLLAIYARSEADAVVASAAWRRVARLRYETGFDCEGARDALEESLRLCGGQDPGLSEEIGELLHEAEHLDELISELLTETQEGFSARHHSENLFRVASLRITYRKGDEDLPSILQEFESAIAAAPEMLRETAVYGELLCRLGVPQRAVEHMHAGALAIRTTQRDNAAALLRRTLSMAQQHLADETVIVTLTEQLHECDPGDPSAFAALAERYEEQERWTQLASLYEAYLTRSLDDSLRLDKLTVLAGIYRTRLRDDDRANATYARARRLDPSHPEVLDFYRRHFRRGGDHESLLQLLWDAQRHTQDGQAQLALLTEIAQLTDETNASLDRQIDAWKAIERVSPEHEEACDTLQRLYAQSGKWNALVDLLKRKADGCTNATDKIAILKEMIAVYREHLHLDVMVIRTYTRIVELDPEDQDAVSELARTYRSLGRWTDLIELLTRLADSSADTVRKIELWSQVADLWIEHFANYNKACEPLENIIATDPSHAPSLRRLREIYARKRAWKPLYKTLKREIELSSHLEASERIELIENAAAISGDRLGLHSEAVELWNKVLREKPGDEKALSGLEKTAERSQKWADVVRVNELRLNSEDDSRAKIKLLQKLAGLYEVQLGDEEKTLDTWQRVLEVEPKNSRALRAVRESLVKYKRWDELEALYGSNGDWEGLADVLGSLAEQQKELSDKLELSFRAARVLEHHVGAPQRALRSYERVLELDHNNISAVSALVPIYESREKWPQLLAMLEKLVKFADGPDTRIELLQRCWDLYREKVRNPVGEFECVAQLFVLDADESTQVQRARSERGPLAPPLLDEMVAAGTKAQRVEKVLELLRQRLAQSEDIAQRLAIQLHISRLVGTEEVEGQLWAVLELAPRNSEANKRLQRIYEERSHHQGLARLYAHRLRVADDPHDRHACLLELAQISMHELRDCPAAIAHLEAALELEPGHQATLRMLVEASVRAKRWREAERAISARLETAELAEVDELRMDLAGIRLQHLDDHQRAYDAIRPIIEGSTVSARCLGFLEELVESTRPAYREDSSTKANADRANGELSRVHAQAFAALEGLLDARGQKRALLDVLQRELDSRQGSERLAIVHRIRDLARGDRSLDALLFAMALEVSAVSPNDLEVWDDLLRASVDDHQRLQALLARAGDVLGAAKVLRSDGDDNVADADEGHGRAAERQVDEATALEIAERLKEVLSARTGFEQASLELCRLIMSMDAGHEEAFAFLRQSYRQTANWVELAALLEARARQVFEEEVRVALLEELSEVYERGLNDLPRAIETHRRILALHPSRTGSRQAVVDLLRRGSSWEELVSELSAELDLDGGAQQLDVAFEIATVSEMHLGRNQEAVELYGAILLRNSMFFRAQQALERLEKSLSGEVGVRVAEILSTLYESQGSWPELARVLRTRLDACQDDDARFALLEQLAELSQQRLQRNEDAFRFAAEAMRLRPFDASIRQRVAKSARAAGQQTQRALLLGELARASESTALRIELTQELAALLQSELEDFEAAEQVYGELARIDPDDSAVVLGAMRELEKIHLQLGAYPDLVEDLRTQIRFEIDEEARIAAWLRLADLFEQVLRDDAQASATYREILDEWPAHALSLERLQRVYERQENWQELVGIMHRRQQVVEDDQEFIVLGEAIGRLYAEKLRDTDNAIVAYQDILERFGPSVAPLDRLADLFTASQRWSDLLEVRLLQVQEAEDLEAAINLSFLVGELQRTRIGDVAASLESYTTVLVQSPGHLGVLRALESVLGEPHDTILRSRAAELLEEEYTRADREEDLVRVLLEHAEIEDSITQYALLRRCVDILRFRPESANQALGLVERLLHHEQGLEQLVELLGFHEELSGKLNTWERFLNEGEWVLQNLHDAVERNALRSRLARRSDRSLGDGVRSRRYLFELLEEDPADVGALLELTDILRKYGAHQELAEVLLRRAELSENKHEALGLRKEAADVAHRLCQRPAWAAEILERVIIEHPEDLAFAELEDLYTKLGDWAQLEGLYERMLEVGYNAETRCKLGVLRVDKLQRVEQGIDDIALAATGDASSSAQTPLPEALAHLERLMHRPDATRVRVAEVLEPIYLKNARWADVTMVMQARLEGVHDPVERKPLLLRLGAVCEEYLDDVDGALAAHLDVFHIDPDDTAIWERLMRLARASEQWMKVTQAFDQRIDDHGVIDEATKDLALLSAQTRLDRLGENPRSTELYRRVLAFDPSHTRSFEALEATYTREEKLEDLIDLYQLRADNEADGEARAQLLVLTAGLYERLGDARLALDMYRQVLEIDPASRDALEKVETLLRQLELWQDLVDHLDAWARQVSSVDFRNTLLQRLAEVVIERVGDEPRGLSTLEEILGSDGAGRDAALAMLEALAARALDRQRIVAILEPIYRENRAWRKLIAILEAKSDLLEDAYSRSEVQQEIAVLQEKRCQDLRRAFRAWGRALMADPANEVSLAQIQRLAPAIDDWDTVAQTLTRAAEAANSPGVSTQLYSLVAEVHDTNRGDPRSALEAYTAAMEQDPENLELLDAVEALQTMLGEWLPLTEALQRRLECLSDPEERSALRIRLAGVFFDLLANADAAIDVLRQSLDESPGDLPTLDALERVLTATDRLADLVSVLEARVEFCDEAAKRVANGLRAGALARDELNEPQRATDMFLRVLDDQPENAEALAALVELYQKRALWHDLATHLETLARVTTGPAQRHDRLFRLASVYERELNAAEDAVQCYAEAAEEGHEASLQALLRLATDAVLAERCFAIAKPLLEAGRRWRELAQAYEAHAKLQEEEAERFVSLVSAGRIHVRNLSEPERGFALFLEALPRTPLGEDLRPELELLAESLNAWSPLAQALREQAEVEQDTERAVEYFDTVAGIYVKHLRERSAAISALLAALERSGEDEHRLQQLRELQLLESDWPSLAVTLERLVQAAPDDQGRAARLLELGCINSERLGEDAKALDCLRESLELDGTRQETVVALQRLGEGEALAREVFEILSEAHRSGHAQVDLPEIYESRIRVTADEGERSQLLQELAGVLETEMGDAERAFDAMGRAFVLAPTDEMLFSEMARLAEAAACWEKAAKVLQYALHRDDLVAARRVDLIVHLAAWLSTKLERLDEAETKLREALSIDAERSEVYAALDDVLLRMHASAERAENLCQWSRVELDSALKGERLRQAGRIALESLGDKPLAAQFLGEALEVDAEDRDALITLRQIQSELGRWREAAVLYERSAQLLIDGLENVGDTYAILVRILDERLDDLDAAIVATKAWRAVAPHDERAVGMLEALLTRAERWEELVALLEERGQFSESFDEQVALRLRRAEILDAKLGDPNRAEEELQEIVALAPEHQGALAALLQLVERQEKWEKLVEVLESGALMLEQQALADEAMSMRIRAMQLCLQRLDDPARVIDIGSLALESSAVSPQPLGEVSSLMARAEQSLGNPAAAIQHWQRMVSSGAEGSAEAALRVLEIVESSAEAPLSLEEALRMAFELNTQNDAVRDRYVELLRSEGRRRELVGVLEIQAETSDDVTQRLSLFKQAAAILENELEDRPQAIATLEKANALEVEDRVLKLALADLYRADGRFEQAARLYHETLDGFRGRRNKEIAKIHHKLGQSYEALGATQKALESYSAAFKIDLTNVQILRDLGRLYYVTEDFPKAQKTFRTLLLQKLEPHAGITRGDVYYYLGDIAAREGDKSKAIAMLERAVSEAAEHEPAAQLLANLRAG